MEGIEGFKSDLNRAVELFKSFDPSKPVCAISHLDADGITACSILVHVLNEESRKHSINIVTQLNVEKLEEISKQDYEYFFFTDLGSGNLSTMDKLFVGKKVIILDHHEVENYTLKSKDIVVVNPHLHGIDGSKTISGSGVVWFFAKTFDIKYEKIAHLAIIGAIGDMQETNGFTGLNEEIFKIAVEQKKMTSHKGLKCFGQNSRPLYKVLEYSTEPYIPGVSGSESGAINFLVGLDIMPKNNNGWRKISDLSNEEMQKLVMGIVMKRSGEKSPEDVIGNIYHLVDEAPDSPIKDAREFTTLLNACGRMDKASFGIGICLGDRTSLDKAVKNQLSYRKEIVKALGWYETNREKSDKIIDGNGYVIINAEDKVLHTIIGTMASILAKGNNIEPNTLILSMARNPIEKQTKVSLRVSGYSNTEDLHAILAKIIAKTGGETGGHMNAAGAVIKTESESEFVNVARSVLDELKGSKV
ncbi:MAG: DHH family phosphoesterase [Candidatus Woesearchaeota archaeon]